VQNKYPDKLSILNWAEEDRPREKLVLKGKSTLTEAELIGILIGSGTSSLSAVDLARLILKKVDYKLHRLARLTVSDLMKFKGIGQAKAVSIVTAFELGRRRTEEEPYPRIQITSSRKAYEALKPVMVDQGQEVFWVLILDRANQVMGKQQVSMGGISGTIADPRVIFKIALDYKASSLILAHNHPSGNLKPSEADIRLTKKLKDAGKMLDIPVLDHIIFTDHSYTSFADEGLL
jgi:DNA repair protein RadC